MKAICLIAVWLAAAEIACAQVPSWAPSVRISPMLAFEADSATPENSEGAVAATEWSICRYPAARGSFTAEYLLWWVRSGPLPAPLVSAGAVNTGDPVTSSGPVTGPGTVVLFGGHRLDFDAFAGGRWTGEIWSPRYGDLGLQVGGYRLEQRSVGFNAAADAAAATIIARPFFDTLQGEESAAFVAFPGAFAGAVGVRADSNLWGLESNLIWRGRWDGCRQTKWLLGFRHLDLEESIDIVHGTRVLAGGGGSFNNVALQPGDSVVIADRFRGRNEFYGAQIGMQTESVRGCWSMGLSLKLSLGCNRQEVHAVGNSSRFDAAGALTDSAFGGALALRTNRGAVRRNDFAAIPELGVKVSRQLSNCLRAFVGYDFTYWSDVVRPGDQINRAVNVGHVPTSDRYNRVAEPLLPAPRFERSDFWAQGLVGGLELRY